jgi:hypothetical protein
VTQAELVPNIAVVVLMVNPQSPEVVRETAQQAARALGWQLHVIAASSVSKSTQLLPRRSGNVRMPS